MRLREQRMYGFHEDRYAHVEGRNSRLDEIQAAVLRVKLRYFEDDLAIRRARAELYHRELDGLPLKPVQSTPGTTHAYHLYVVRVQNRNEIIEEFKRHDIGCAIHYPQPVHTMNAYAFLNRPEGFPISEQGCEKVLSLPLYAGISEEDVLQVCKALREALTKQKVNSD